MKRNNPAGPHTFLEADAALRCGPAHDNNEDAYFVDIERGVFSIADGMGGHRDGHVASRAVISMLDEALPHAASLECRIDKATHAIRRVNNTLFNQSMEHSDKDICGSTVITLLVDAGYACCLWAGDSRLYLFRDEYLYLVSEDHADSGGALTRAVGASSDLVLDRGLVEVRPGDIFLLCSDGLLKGMSENRLADMLSQSGSGLTDRMLAESVSGGSTDDITLIVVWIRSHGE